LRDLIKAGVLEINTKWRDQDMKRILNLIKLVKFILNISRLNNNNNLFNILYY